MKKIMSTFIFALLIIGFAYLVYVNRPQNFSDDDIKSWFSSKLTDIATDLEKDIASDIKGEYPHAGRQSFDRRGMIVYVLLDKNFSRFDISDKNEINSLDIVETEGYRKLDAKVRELDLSIRLEEKEVEGDDVESFDELDEYIDDFPRYYTVTIGGW
jgi:hypothetical protein